MQSFCHTNTGRFILLPLESREGDTGHFLVHQENFSHYHWKPGRATHSTNTKHGEGEKQIVEIERY